MGIILSWVFNFFAVLGAFEGSKKKVNAGLMNFFYSINNIFSIFYFIYLNEWSFLVLSSVFLIFSIRGIYFSIRRKSRMKILKNIKDFDKLLQFLNQNKGLCQDQLSFQVVFHK